MVAGRAVAADRGTIGSSPTWRWWALLGFALGMTEMTTILCGRATAFRTNGSVSLQRSRTAAHRLVRHRAGRMASGLIVAQVALSMVNGLRRPGTCARLRADTFIISAGFTPEGVVAAQVIALSGAPTAKGRGRDPLMERGDARVARSRAWSRQAPRICCHPGRGDWSTSRGIRAEKTPTPITRRAAPRDAGGYFETADRMRQGRTFTAGDDEKSQLVFDRDDAGCGMYFRA